MSVAPAIREQVRQRARFACEFCGVTETDTGGLLTVDHFRPQGKGGTEDLANLAYCCVRCNQYKQDYWPPSQSEPVLWNPRETPSSRHFVELETGHLHPLTAVGAFTLRWLRLNRPPLVAWRLHKRRRAEEVRLLEEYRDLVQLLAQLHRQQAILLEDQRELLAEQDVLLRLLPGGE